ncbi:MAG: Holliday junction branch migration protein RuvA [Rikenellaceae bacterium]|nr:Holliday junction branch migration protein RuvA [Rikenellaceae bacterium]MCL2693178.1 Holliday junction branch migration protein RuvA [Rikenellaceae bacterium]
MIEYIKGTIADLTPAYAVVEAGGVGYYMSISLHTFSQIEGRAEATLYAHTQTLMDSSQNLFGFSTRRERELFRLLIGVSGVGGNTARMALSTYSPGELANIIATENAVLLKNVKGLGLKTAQKIIVELRDKVITVGFEAACGTPGTATTDSPVFHETLAALTMLGFGRAASEKVVRNVVKEHPDASVEEAVRLSLKKL